MRTDKEYLEAITTLTGYPEWAVLVEEFKSLIYQLQAGALEADSWDKVVEAKGFARGMAYIVNLRDTNTALKEVEDSNAHI